MQCVTDAFCLGNHSRSVPSCLRHPSLIVPFTITYFVSLVHFLFNHEQVPLNLMLSGLSGRWHLPHGDSWVKPSWVKKQQSRGQEHVCLPSAFTSPWFGHAVRGSQPSLSPCQGEKWCPGCIAFSHCTRQTFLDMNPIQISLHDHWSFSHVLHLCP